jgi:hypothetical protein
LRSARYLSSKYRHPQQQDRDDAIGIKKKRKFLVQYQCKYSPCPVRRVYVIGDVLLERQVCLVSGRAPSLASSPISNCRGNCDGKMAARPHRGASSPRDTQPHAPDVFSIFYQKKHVRRRNQLKRLREREMNAQKRGETSDDEQEGEETEDEGCFTPR